MSPDIITSRGPISVRPAVPGDAAAVLDLRLEALSAHPEAFGADYERTAADGPGLWAERIRENMLENKGVLVVAEAGARLVGMAGLIRGNWPKTSLAGSIYGVFVSPAWRGLRLTDAMLEECSTWAHAHHLATLKLAVITINTAAIRCYTRWGFSVYGVEPKAIFWKGVFYDDLLMVKLL
jgi:RimJ/RimL family protein N-acetyltransferase